MDEPEQTPQPASGRSASQPDAQPASPQRRLQELRAIPEKDRTDSQWDELNEVEIALAAANRAGGPNPGQGRDAGSNRPQQQRRGGNPPGGKPGDKSNHRHRRNRGRQGQR